MNPNTWNRIKEIHADALERAPHERDAFIAAACDGDTEIRSQVASLLAADAEAGEFLGDLTCNESEHVARYFHNAESPIAAPAEQIGTHIDRYVLSECLGEGGFGSVYRAEQMEPVRRAVALKLIKPGMDSRQVLARFDAERQALAVMDHPCIAKVFDAGTTATGRPYFVMELVDGAQITTYCDTQRMSLDDRLRIFLDVCAAVQHAHQKGIIHRDLKPSNVLVSSDGMSAAPKVIDFGVAKAIQSQLTNITLTTQQQIIGTPAYMSPEQAGASPHGVDTRSDVYSLGVLLYELMTGVTPFDSASLLNVGYGEMLRIIQQEEPAKPSTRISRLRNDASSAEQLPADRRQNDASSSVAIDAIADVRRIDRIALRRRLSGDLDWIVMKCLEKDADRRYPSAASLAEDIRRHLQDEPVMAGPPAAAYRLRKFAMRNRGAVVATICVAMALAVGTVASTIGFVRADRARERAQDAEASAESVTKYLGEMLAAVSPDDLGRDATLRDILDRQDEKLSKQFTDQPLVEARLRVTIGNTYTAMGLFESGESHLRQAVAIRERELSREDPLTTDAIQRLAANLRAQSHYDAALLLLEEAAAAHERSLGPTARRTLMSKYELAVLLRVMKQYERSESMSRALLEDCRNALGIGDKLTLEAQQNLASVCAVTGQLDESRTLNEEAARLQSELLGPEHPDTLLTRFDLAIRHCMDGEHARAMAAYPDILAGHARTLGEDHRMTLAVQSFHAREHLHVGKAEEADALMSRTLPKQLALLGDAHRDVIESLGYAAEIKDAIAEKAAALEIRETLLKTLAAHRGPDDPATLQAKVNLAASLFEAGDIERSESLHREALAGYRITRGAADDQVVNSSLHLVNLLHAAGRYDEEATIIDTALRDLRVVRGETDADVYELIHRRGHMLQATGQASEALQLYRESYDAQFSSIGDPAQIRHYSSCLLSALMGQREFREATEVLTQQIAFERQQSPDDSIEIANLLDRLAYCRIESDEFRDGEKHARDALAIRTSLSPDDALRIGGSKMLVAVSLTRQNHYSEAEAMLRDVLAIRENVFPPNHWLIHNTRSQLGECVLEQGRINEAADLITAAHEGLTSDASTPESRLDESSSRLKRLRRMADHDSP